MANDPAQRPSSAVGTIGDLFCGIGGFSLGFERVGFETIWQVENDKDCTEVLERHWPAVRRYGDIKSVNASELERPDVVCGGPPCQDVSTNQNGRRKGLAGSRTGLFWDAHRVIGGLRPKWFVLENVKGLLSSNQGKDLDVIVQAFSELGYCVSWRVLDSAHFGVPQHRERVYIVGSLGHTGSVQVLFEGLPQATEATPAETPPQALEPVAINPYQQNSNGVGISRIVHTLDSRPDRVVLSPFDRDRVGEATGFSGIESKIILSICSDLRKKNVNVVQLSHKWPKLVFPVASDKLQSLAPFAEISLQRGSLSDSKLAPLDVHIDCEACVVAVKQAGKLLSYASSVQPEKWCHQVMPIESFVRLSALVTSIQAPITPSGKGALPLNMMHSTHRPYGNNVVNVYGLEMLELAKNVEQFTKMAQESMKSITSGVIMTSQSSEQMWTILYYYVVYVINLCIPDRTSTADLLDVSLTTYKGYTFGASRVKRTKMIGNAVTVSVVEWIARRIKSFEHALRCQ